MLLANGDQRGSTAPYHTTQMRPGGGASRISAGDGRLVLFEEVREVGRRHEEERRRDASCAFAEGLALGEYCRRSPR